jgi:hypothetical protein
MIRAYREGNISTERAGATVAAVASLLLMPMLPMLPLVAAEAADETTRLQKVIACMNFVISAVLRPDYRIAGLDRRHSVC